MQIRYCPHQEIDKSRWDELIEEASNGLPYVYSWYLDIVTDGQWDALIANDYQLVMPLAWNKKFFGLPQLYQPVICQQGGIFGKNLSPDIVHQFLNNIPKKFKLIAINLNEGNQLTGKHSFQIKKRRNLLLPLNQPYEQIQKGYSKSLRKRIRKAQEIYHTMTTQDAAQVVTFYQGNLEQKVRLGKTNYAKIQHLIHAAIQRKKGKIVAILNDDGQLDACGFFLFSHGRIINVFGASNERGKISGAMPFMLDALIQKHTESKWTFDFEGSQIDSVAVFFRSFGSTETHYFRLEKYAWPVLVNWIRKIRNGLPK